MNILPSRYSANDRAKTAAELDVLVGSRIRERRETMRLTQGQLARHLGLTFSQIQKYEKGTNRIGAGRLYLVAAVLRVPVEYFFVSPDGSQAPVTSDTEIAALGEAYLAITDSDARASVMALVRSLAASPDATRPRIYA